METLSNMSDQLHRNKAALGHDEKPGAFDSKATDNNDEPKIIKIRRFLDENYEFRMDEVGNEIEVRAKRSTKEGDDVFKGVNENTLLVRLYELGYKSFEKQFMALMRSDYVPAYNPIKTYFDNLPEWNENKPDYIAQLANYVKAKNQAWFITQYKKWLIRAVACGIGKIPFNKQCLVFVGKQNDGKSTFIRFHVPKELEAYYTEHIEFSGGVDGKIALCENFLINIDELSSFSKMDINKCKAALTEAKVKVRRPFAKKPVPDIRRASFFGSTNQTNFLTDETGNVRWLVMEIYDILHDNGGSQGYEHNVDINLVWSQAYALLNSGFRYQMTSEEIEESERYNNGHMLVSVEHELVSHHFKPADPNEEGAHFMMTGEIVDWLQRRYDYRLKINSNNIGKALRAMGFKISSGRRSDCANPIYAYWIQSYDM